jgi:DNA-directed RNA polymerase subunit beta
MKPIVRKGQKIKKGDVLTEGYATSKGELALGKNLLAAFMPWKGYNFEDAIVISEKVVSDDIFTSIHIVEHQLDVRETKRGPEELTPDIPNVSEEATKYLDENGMIRIGAKVKPGDILIGKITPKGESDPSPEEKLLRAIFGEKAGDVKDASMKVSPSGGGIIIDKKLFELIKRTRGAAQNPLVAKLDKDFEVKANDLRKLLNDKLAVILRGKTCQGVKDTLGNIVVEKGVKFTDKIIESLDVFELNTKKWITDRNKSEIVEKLVHNYIIKYKQIEAKYKRQRYNLQVGDELPVGIIKMAKVYQAKKRKLKVGDKLAGRHGN